MSSRPTPGTTRLAFALALALGAAPRAAAGPAAALLDEVQRATLADFWEGAHPVSGLAPERTSTPEVVTTGGSGFGFMGWVIGVERGWLPRDAVRDRALAALDFLARAARFRGAWPHWLDGRTGEVKPFSPKDDGADLVETAFLVQGMLQLREFFDREHPAEARLRARVDELVGGVEWSWFTRGEPRLYWHWSPRHGFAMDLPIQGWNEALLAYVLAAGAAEHAIAPEAYHEGWARGGAMRSGARYEDVVLPLGPPWGGPLFLSHYSFLGLDPSRLVDRYADYGEQVRAHARIHRAYCARDPEGHGYSASLWGLTASDTPGGYAAHSPTEDRGVLTPSAALGSFPYLPRAGWAALLAFRRWQGGRLWGPRGFADAFRPATGWVAADRLAIDQGPILVMLENHRSGRPWARGMRAPEVRRGLARLGFTVRPERRRLVATTTRE